MHVFIWHKWKGMLTWNRSLKMKHLKKGEKYMNWCYKHYAMIIPCLHHQEIYDCYHCYMPCIKISNKILLHSFTHWYLTTWWNATIDEHLKCNPLSYWFFNKSMLVIHEFIECNFEDDFRFVKCLIRIYDIRYTLNMNHASIMLNASIIFYL